MTLPTKEELDRLAAVLDGYASSMLHRDIGDDFKAAAGVCRRALELEKALRSAHMMLSTLGNVEDEHPWDTHTTNKFIGVMLEVESALAGKDQP